MIFKSLMVAGCLAALQSDFASLSPAMPQLPTATAAMSVVHLLRKLVLALATPTPNPDPDPDPYPDPDPNPNAKPDQVLAFAIGFCFSPVTGRDHGVAEMRRKFYAVAAEPGSTEADLRARLKTVLTLTLTLT